MKIDLKNTNLISRSLNYLPIVIFMEINISSLMKEKQTIKSLSMDQKARKYSNE
jgi:hypothetical protein